MKIVCFNINSIRARPHQLIHIRDTLNPDVIGLQETKVNDPDFPFEEIKKITVKRFQNFRNILSLKQRRPAREHPVVVRMGVYQNLSGEMR